MYVVVVVIRGVPEVYFETSKKKALSFAEKIAKNADYVIVSYSPGLAGKGQKLREWDMRK